MSLSDAVTAAQKAGFNGVHLVEAVSIASAESGGVVNEQTHDSNGTTDYGLWQINSIHCDGRGENFSSQRLLTDAVYNAECAYSLSKGGTDWGPWASFNNHSAQAAVGTAETAIQQTLPVTSAPTASTPGVQTAGFWSDLGSGGAQLFAGSPLGTLAGKEAGTVNGVVNGTEALGSLAGNLTSGKFWVRVGEGALALLLIALGITFILHKEVASTAKDAVKGAILA